MAGLVSIIMPSYNTGRFIAETVRSVMAQTYTDWELIIVDDCSTDNTMDSLRVILSEAKDLASKIRIFQNEKNSGAAVSRNRALREARGKYIAFLDSDDLWAPNKLERQVAFMERNGYAFTYTKYFEIDENGNSLGAVVGGPRHIGKIGMYNYCWPGCLTVMYDREVVGDIQIADIKKNNDYAMWLKVIRKVDCHLLPESLAKYRKRSGSISHTERHCEAKPKQSKTSKKDDTLSRYLSLIKWHYRLYHEAEGMNPVRSAWITFRNLGFGVWKKVMYVGKA